jgi:hypothetical protein
MSRAALMSASILDGRQLRAEGLRKAEAAWAALEAHGRHVPELIRDSVYADVRAETVREHPAYELVEKRRGRPF